MKPILLREPNPTATHSNRSNNYGRKEKVTADGNRAELARVATDRETFYTVSAEVVNLVGFPDGDPTVQPLILITWASGNSTFEKVVQPLFHIDVPVMGNSVRVSCFIGNPFTKANVELAGCSADFVISVSEGVTGLPQRQSLFVVAGAVAAGQNVANGPQRLFSVRGYNNNATTLWLMGFDTALGFDVIPNGRVPDVSVPIPPGGAGNSGAYSDTWLNTRPFRDGLRWVLSSTPDVLTAVAGASVRIETELALI